MRKKRRRLRRPIRIALVLSVFLLSLYLLLHLIFTWPFWGVKSLNKGTSRYRSGNCLVFYPSNNKIGKFNAQKMCKNIKTKTIFDYQIKTIGEAKVVTYSNGNSFLVDKNFKDIKASKDPLFLTRVRDYLFYALRSNKRKELSDLNFYEQIDLSHEYITIKDNHLLIHFSKYDIDTFMPLQYVGKALGLDLGVKETEEYKAPNYINKEGKLLCFTFDDGPNHESSHKIMDILRKYDARATFFVVGQRLSDDGLALIRKGISYGQEYGCHTYSHPNLTTLSKEEIEREINSPVKVIKDNLNYEMKLLRPPYGAINDEVRSLTSLRVTLWNVDSEDWRVRDKEKIIANVKHAKDGNIVLFHDIFAETADAIAELLPYYISQSYQFITVSEMLSLLN